MPTVVSPPCEATHIEKSICPQLKCGEVFNLNEDEEIVMSQSEKKITQDSAKSTETTTNKYKGFSEEERAAMKERAKEQKAEARANKDRAEGESDVLAKIAEMPEPDRSMATRIHEIIKESAPVLSPKTWYGMPAYAKDGKIVCSFRPAPKFNTRYATFSFEDSANLDEGTMWATAFALKELTAEVEAKIVALVKKAVS